MIATTINELSDQMTARYKDKNTLTHDDKRRKGKICSIEWNHLTQATTLLFICSLNDLQKKINQIKSQERIELTKISGMIKTNFPWIFDEHWKICVFSTPLKTVKSFYFYNLINDCLSFVHTYYNFV